MKRTYPKPIAEIIDNVLLSGDNRRTVLEQRACYLWPEIVGPGVNRYTFRRYVDHGVLHVYLTSAPLKNELSFHRTSICQAINKALGDDIITEIMLH